MVCYTSIDITSCKRLSNRAEGLIDVGRSAINGTLHACKRLLAATSGFKSPLVQGMLKCYSRGLILIKHVQAMRLAQLCVQFKLWKTFMLARPCFSILCLFSNVWYSGEPIIHYCYASATNLIDEVADEWGSVDYRYRPTRVFHVYRSLYHHEQCIIVEALP